MHEFSKIEYLRKKRKIERWIQPLGAEEYTQILPTGEVYFVSLGEECVIGLSPSGEEIYIEYLRYLPSLDTKVIHIKCIILTLIANLEGKDQSLRC